MSPTWEEQVVLLRAQIEEWDLSLKRWADTSMPAYRRTILLKQNALAELGRLEHMQRTAEARTDTKIDLKTFVKQALAKKGWSVHDFANKAGVDFHTADNILKGKTKRPYPGTLKKLADALGVAITDLPT